MFSDLYDKASKGLTSDITWSLLAVSLSSLVEVLRLGLSRKVKPVSLGLNLKETKGLVAFVGKRSR